MEDETYPYRAIKAVCKNKRNKNSRNINTDLHIESGDCEFVKEPANSSITPITSSEDAIDDSSSSVCDDSNNNVTSISRPTEKEYIF